MTVSVVIPTMFRTELLEAVESVRTQTIGRSSVEIVVVADRSETDLPQHLADALTDVDQLLFTGGGAGAPAARNLGVRASHGEWIAFLDDDDYWVSTKLEEQLAAANSVGTSKGVVVASRVRQSRGIVEPVSDAVPSQCFNGHGPIEQYLFQNRSPSLGRASIFTSTLFVDRSLALRTPWNIGLARHQDWDWLIRAQRSGAVVRQLESVLSVQRVGSAGSISASTDWRSSLDWAKSWKEEWHRQTYADFVAGQPLRYALQARSFAGVLLCLREILRSARVPSLGPILIGSAGLMSRKQLEKVLVRRPPVRG